LTPALDCCILLLAVDIPKKPAIFLMGLVSEGSSASDLGSYVSFGPSAASPRSPKVIAEGILHRNALAG